jgi:hypothetical protein
MSPEGVQKTMTMFELSIYSPTIEEAWTDTCISRLKVDAAPGPKWIDPLEAMVYPAGMYLA